MAQSRIALNKAEAKMTKLELIDRVYKVMLLQDVTKRQVEEIIDLTTEEMRKSIKEEKRFILSNFGTFTVRLRKERRGVNPRTGKPIRIPASRTVGFKPAPILKKGL